MTETNFKVALKDLELPKDWNRDSGGSHKINNLATSLKLIGQVVAMVVKPGSQPGKFVLKDGRRRYMAMKEAGITEAIVTLYEGEGLDEAAVAIVANMNREGHTPMEIAMAFQALKDSGRKNQDIARLCGMTGGYVSQYLDLLKLPEGAQEAIRKGFLTFSQARTLQKLDMTKPKHVRQFEKLYARAIEGKSSTQDMETRVMAFLDKEPSVEKEADTGKKKAPGRPIKTTNYEELKADIKPLSKEIIFECLVKAEARRVRSTSQKNQTYLAGYLNGGSGGGIEGRLSQHNVSRDVSPFLRNVCFRSLSARSLICRTLSGVTPVISDN